MVQRSFLGKVPSQILRLISTHQFFSVGEKPGDTQTGPRATRDPKRLRGGSAEPSPLQAHRALLFQRGLSIHVDVSPSCQLLLGAEKEAPSYRPGPRGQARGKPPRGLSISPGRLLWLLRHSLFVQFLLCPSPGVSTAAARSQRP